MTTNRSPVLLLTPIAVIAVIALSCGSEGGEGAASDQRGDSESTATDTTETTLELDISGGDSRSTLPTGDPVDLDDPVLSPLAGGTYRTGIFEPAFTFTVPDGLHLLTQVPYGLGLAPDPTALIDLDAKVFSATRLEDVQVPVPVIREPGEEKAWGPLPEDIVGWLTDIEVLEITASAPVTVGGLDGTVLDFTVDLPDDSSPCTPINVPCVILFRHSPTGVSTFYPDNQIVRMWVLESAREPVLLIAESPPTADAQKWLDTGAEIVSTIEFE